MMKQDNYTNVNIFKRAFEEREVASSKNMTVHADTMLAPTKEHRGFNPYQNNEGTVIGKWELGGLKAPVRATQPG